MSFNGSADVLQRVGGGRFTVRIADDEFSDKSRPAEMVGEFRLRQNEQRLDAIEPRQLYGAKVESHGDVWETRLLRRTVVIVRN